MMQFNTLSFACSLVATALFFFPSIEGRGLVDDSIVAVSHQYFDGEGWVVTSQDGNTVINGKVPGDLVTDLQLAGLVSDPLYELNWLPMGTSAPPLWDNQNWTYSYVFDANTNILSNPNVWLVLDGIKMAADVYVNGVYLGFSNDQFLRKVFDVTNVVRAINNTLTIVFSTTQDPRNLEGRWMGCTGGWDWAYYTNTATSQGTRSFSKGIWKSVYLAGVTSTAITSIVPHVYYNGTYPTAPLTDAAAGPWTVAVGVHFTSPVATSGTVSITSDFGASVSQPVSLSAGNSSVTLTMTVPVGGVNLWWPVRLGNQTLYHVNVSYIPSSSSEPTLVDSRRIGFRVLYLVTVNDTVNPGQYSGQDGSGDFTMRFKVNGADIYSRGGNMIPMDELEGRLSAEAHHQLVDSAAAGGMNTFRIWGGGIFYPDAFYDAADELGMIMYHDAMYSGDGRVNPYGNDIEDAEIRYQIRRLSHHPSIAIWDACNECFGGGIWDSFVSTTIAQEDTSRPVWPSCPSVGWTTGVDMLTGLPNGQPLKTRPSSIDRNSLPPRSVDEGIFRFYTAPCGSAAGNCTYVDGLDYDQGFIGKEPAAPDAPTCCNLCEADPTNCYAASFYEGTCYFKPPNKPFSWGNGVISVFPPGAVPPPTPARTIETHGYYQHGGGFPAVNGDASLSPFSTSIPLSLASNGPRGTGYYGVYASEFGASVMSSFESMAPTLAPEHWALHGGVPADDCSGSGWPSTCKGGNPMAQRNYPCTNFLLSYGLTNALSRVNNTDPDIFKKELYLCTLTQALFLRSDIEYRRSDNQFGTVTWQLNEIWPTGGWGSLEYSSTGFTQGQVLGGRWKPLHYWFAQHLYRDQITACGSDGRCYFRNDDPINGWTGTINLSFVHLATGAVSPIQVVPVTVPRGAASFAWYCIGTGNITAGCTSLTTVLSAYGCSSNGNDCILIANATSSTGIVSDENWQIFALPGNLTNPSNTQVTFTIGQPNADNSVPITVTSDSVALYVHLITLANGRFSDNAFHLAGNPTYNGGNSRIITFYPFGDLDYGLLTTTLRLEHFAQSLN